MSNAERSGRLTAEQIIAYALRGGVKVYFAGELATDREWSPEESGGEIVAEGSAGLARDPAEIVGDQVFCEGLLGRIKPLWAEVVRLYYFEEMSQTEIARSLGISNNYVSHILRYAIEKMRALVKVDGIAESRKLAA